MTLRVVRLALCALGPKNEQWVRIVLPRAQSAEIEIQALAAPPFGSCDLALVDCDSPASLAVYADLAQGNPALRSIWISNEGDVGGEGPKLPRRALMFRLAPVMKEMLAAAPQLGAPPAVRHEYPAPLLASEGRGERRLEALVVDDSLTVRTQLAAVLEHLGLAVTHAASAEQAEQLIERRRFDLVFLDVVLPGRDGYAVCKALRKRPETSDLVILMLTSRSAPFDRARGALAGCDLYLTKPVAWREVVEAVDRAVMKAYKQDRAAVLSRGYRPQLA